MLEEYVIVIVSMELDGEFESVGEKDVEREHAARKTGAATVQPHLHLGCAFPFQRFGLFQTC